MTRLTTIEGIRSGLLEHCIEVQALGWRMTHASPELRDQAREVRAQAHELSKLVRKLAPSPEEQDALRMFFPSHCGRQPDENKFIHLED